MFEGIRHLPEPGFRDSLAVRGKLCPFPPSQVPAFYRENPCSKVIGDEERDEQTHTRPEKLWDTASFINVSAIRPRGQGIVSLRHCFYARG